MMFYRTKPCHGVEDAISGTASAANSYLLKSAVSNSLFI
jgi:hypothetical protein